MKAPQPFLADKTLPLLVGAGGEVAGNPEALADWARAQRARLDDWLHEAGAVLFRGFGLSGTEDFRAVCCAVRPELAAYVGGDSPRVSVADQVYTSTEFPPELEIALHNELSYGGWWPKRLFFTCQTAARSGGETHIADGRAIYANLDRAVRHKFEERGVTYIQHLRDESGPHGSGKSWQETFETRDKAAAEAYCRDSGMDFDWTGRGLSTAILRPGVIQHPVTGESVWFNQADQWHSSAGGVKHQETEDTGNGEKALPCHARFGDGSEISAEDLAAVHAAYRASEVLFPWQEGDFLVLDNEMALHGRKPFTGKRRTLVAMA